MATKRKPVNPNNGNSRRNFRPAAETNRFESKGTKPLPEPASIKHIMVMMVIHVCRKALFVDTTIKVGVYGGGLFILSLIADFIPMPKTYLARTDNFLNVYFVKLGWGWTLLMTLPFIVLTSYTYCCGQREKVVKHLLRLLVATGMWYIWTSLFSYIEYSYGKCYIKSDIYDTKKKCTNAGYIWRGLDVSGHAFILIYSTLVIIEEAKAINGWEGIGDLIRNEEYSRTSTDSDVENSPLRNLSPNEFFTLKDSYTKFTPFVRGIFIGMTLLSLIWDIMLVGTILYHHIMIEKFIGGVLAISMWFLTYRVWFVLPNSVPCLPGDGGTFKYKDVRTKDVPLKKRGSMCNHNTSQNTQKGQMPRFMGMPLYGLKTDTGTVTNDENNTQETVEVNNKWQPRRQDYFENN